LVIWKVSYNLEGLNENMACVKVDPVRGFARRLKALGGHFIVSEAQEGFFRVAWRVALGDDRRH
jgi:hypothetical protein